MNKVSLPKNWIVVSSKSYPGTVYYFNVKTNQASWIEPSAEDSEQNESKGKESPRKRKKMHDHQSPRRPFTPEHSQVEKPTPVRKKLTAKRVLPQCKEERETQQMKDLRELMRKRQEKVVASKKESSKNSKQVNKPKELLPSPATATKAIVPPKSPETVQSVDVRSGGSKQGKVEVFTPQMRAIYQKMQQRALRMPAKLKKMQSNNDSKSVIVSDNDTKNKKGESVIVSDNDTKNKKGESVKLRRPKSQISPISSTSDSSSLRVDSTQNKKERDKTETIRRYTLREKASVEPSPAKKGRKSLRKNIGKERMETLRKSLNSEKASQESDSLSNLSRDSHESGEPVEEPPSIYKTAQVRIVNLKHKLSNDKRSTIKVPKPVDDVEEAKKPSDSITTTEELVKRAYENSFEEQMDWEPMEDERITFEVQAVRTKLCATTGISSVTSNVPNNTLMQPLLAEQQAKQQLYIVVDTNIFLSNIDSVTLARDITFRLYDQPHIVIPWTVIRELDYIKDDKAKTRPASLRAKARRAVEYLNQLFSSNHPRVIGQTPEDVARNKKRFATDCPDDEILQTCLQIRDLGKTVVLLSYDKNLCTKGMIYNIVTLGRDDSFDKIDHCVKPVGQLESILSQQDSELTSILDQELRIANQVLEDTQNLVRDVLTVIVMREMQTLYGDSWEKYVIIQPPWTIVTVLKCAVKHWMAAVSDSFLRKAEFLLKELLEIFNTTGSGKTLREISSIVSKCHDLIQMIDGDKHADLILRASHKIKELKQKCREYEIQINEKKLQDAIGVETDLAESERRAEKAFRYFEATYNFYLGMCGMAVESIGMPCGFHYELPNPLPTTDYLRRIQPELTTNLSNLLHALSTVLEQADNSCIDQRSLTNLYQALVTLVPDSARAWPELRPGDLAPLDIHCCVKEKKDLLQTGLRQLQELCSHFYRLASYKSIKT